MDQYSGIGFFQFDNLIRGRVPFHIVNFGVDFDPLYPMNKFPVERLQVRNREILLSADAPVDLALAEMQQRQVGVREPIVIVTQEGPQALRVAERLGAGGFTNVYFVKGGMAELLVQAANEGNC